jgi:hypothetical protein
MDHNPKFSNNIRSIAPSHSSGDNWRDNILFGGASPAAYAPREDAQDDSLDRLLMPLIPPPEAVFRSRSLC